MTKEIAFFPASLGSSGFELDESCFPLSSWVVFKPSIPCTLKFCWFGCNAPSAWGVLNCIGGLKPAAGAIIWEPCIPWCCPKPKCNLISKYLTRWSKGRKSNSSHYQGWHSKLHFHMGLWVDLSWTAVFHQTSHYVGVCLEEGDLPCNVPSNREKSKTPSRKACCHYLDQISPTPALKPLRKAKIEIIEHL